MALFGRHQQRPLESGGRALDVLRPYGQGRVFELAEGCPPPRKQITPSRWLSTGPSFATRFIPSAREFTRSTS